VFIMHSDGQTNVLDQAPATARHVFLAQEHRDLDDTIALLASDNASDEALLARLKKRKLHLKDELAKLEATV
jgi:hypothetical protein